MKAAFKKSASGKPGTRLRLARHRHGGTLVECVIIMGLLLSMSFGMVEFGWAFYCKNILVGAAREGARNAITPSSTTATVTTAVNDAMAPTGWPSANYTIAITDTSGNALNPASVTVGSQIEVTVSGSWGTLGKGFSPLQLMSTGKTISGSVVMRKEQ